MKVTKDAVNEAFETVFRVLGNIKHIPDRTDREYLETKYSGVLKYLTYLAEFFNGRHGQSEVLKAYQDIPLESKVYVHNNGLLPEWINPYSGTFIRYDPVEVEQ